MEGQDILDMAFAKSKSGATTTREFFVSFQSGKRKQKSAVFQRPILVSVIVIHDSDDVDYGTCASISDPRQHRDRANAAQSAADIIPISTSIFDLVYELWF